MGWWTMMVTWWGASCMLASEERLDQRVLEMRDHEIDAFDALDALGERDLKAMREAGRRLAREDEVPGLPPPAAPLLQATRQVGAQIADAEDLAQATAALAQLPAYCGACHEVLAVQPQAPARDQAYEEAFFAVAFREEARWARAASGLSHLGALEASPWGERQEVLARALQERVGVQQGDDHE